MKNIGVLGLGDDHCAINASIFNHFARQAKFVKSGSAEWRSNHSEPHACDTVEPSAQIFRQCTSFCVETAQRELGLESEKLEKCRAVLLHANRHMRDLYTSIKKQICGNARHPLFFVRISQPEGGWTWRAWLFTRAVFKPRAIDAVAVYPDPEGVEAEGLAPPFILNLDIEHIEESPHSVPRFICMDEIMVEMASLQLVFPEAELEYCYNPAYDQSFLRPLTELRVTGPFSWTPVDCVAPDGGSDGDDQDTDQELDEINDMLSSLASFGASAGKKASKRKTDSSRSAGRLSCQSLFSQYYLRQSYQINVKLSS